MIEARWFIKETVRGADGQIVKGDDGKPKKEGPFLDAKGISKMSWCSSLNIFLVNRTVMGLYNTHLRKATLDTLAKNNDEISDEQKLKVNKVKWDASQKAQNNEESNNEILGAS